MALLNDGARPDDALRAMADAHATLLERLRATPFDPATPSLLPGWTIGHVLTHIARNADSFTGLIDTAARGEIGDQYPGGVEQRGADIERGAPRSRAELVADVEQACARLERACAALDGDTWQRGLGRVTIGEVPIAVLPARRCRETTIHHRDLGLGYTVADFPADFVDAEIPNVAGTLPNRLPRGVTVTLVVEETGARVGDGDVIVRAPRHALFAWLIGRGELDGAPELRAW